MVGEQQRADSVSYTHLDVYKRQVFKCRVLINSEIVSTKLAQSSTISTVGLLLGIR